MPLAALHLAQCGGSATRAELLEVMTAGTLASALRSGEVARRRRGVYGLPLDGEMRRAAELDAALSHRSAALHHGWGVLSRPSSPELVVDRGRRVRRDRTTGVALRYRSLARADVEDHVTTPLRTVVDCARDLPLPEALAVADSAVRAGAVTVLDLARVIPQLPRVGRAPAELVLGLASAAAANPFESGLRALAVQASGPIWRPQPEIVLRDGSVRHPDVGCDELRIALEADSHAHHKSRGDVVRDCHRYVEMTVLGWCVLRFAWEHVMSHQAWVREVIAAVVEGARVSDGSSRRRARDAGGVSAPR
ncbi:endonuclease domain-containing protein [Janibacter melonis]|uniref:DUF559 domain-containing protein n=1 Tax=Janibacter melonis TaxID=262209 RepID=UPI002043B6DB|nr:DUF559 domain-containing protein [Janibacter melonis]MCM3554323.1 endonuclease domain-containing protein [Janibacter melonis]